MKHYFFINPMAGQGKGIDKLIEEIETTAAELQQEAVIYLTKSVEDGITKARETAEALNGEPARFYACGGDGTNNEIINGAADFPNIALGCVPIGTGNDMVRNFPEAGDFLSIKSQMLGEVKRIDLMKYKGRLNGQMKEGYCVNMFNIGLDCDVVALTNVLKKKPFIAGSMAYLLAVGGMFLRKKPIHMQLFEDDKLMVDGEVLLVAIANGGYCGGGMNTSPQSCMNDGVFDLNIIKNVSHAAFLKLFPKYKAGTHLQVPGIEKVITTKQSKALTMVPKQKDFNICIDGEIYAAEGQIEYSMAEGALQFIVPARL